MPVRPEAARNGSSPASTTQLQLLVVSETCVRYVDGQALTRAEWVRFYCPYTTHFGVELYAQIGRDDPHSTCPIPEGVRLLCAPTFRSKWDFIWKSPGIVAGLFGAVRRSDVVLCIMPGLPGIPAALMGRLLGKQVVVLAAGVWSEVSGRPARGIAAATKKAAAILSAALANVIFVMSQVLIGEIPQRFRKKIKAFEITTLIEDDFGPVHARSLADAPLLCVSRLVALKRIDVAVEAVALLRSRGIAARLRVLGDGPELASLEALVRRLELTEAVTFEGYVDDVNHLRAAYRTAFAFVMPTAFNEGLPRSVVDAMAGAVPVVSTGLGGLGDLFDHERNALVVAVDSAAEVADAVERLMRSDDLYVRLASAAQATVRPMMQQNWIEHLHTTVSTSSPRNRP
jgi:glycosyltransferase involved in cell wall biosynthesis